MNLNKVLSENLKALRRQLGVTQMFVADKLNITCQSYQAYEWGIGLPSLENFVKLADVFDVSLDFLLGRKEY